MPSLRIQEFNVTTGNRLSSIRIPLIVAKVLPKVIPKSLIRITRKDLDEDAFQDLLKSLPDFIETVAQLDDKNTEDEGLIFEKEYDLDGEPRRTVVFVK